jgi:hypothetical protein
MIDGNIGLVIMRKRNTPGLLVHRTDGTIRINTPSTDGAVLTLEQAQALRRQLSRYIREIKELKT